MMTGIRLSDEQLIELLRTSERRLRVANDHRHEQLHSTQIKNPKVSLHSLVVPFTPSAKTTATTLQLPTAAFTQHSVDGTGQWRNQKSPRTKSAKATKSNAGLDWYDLPRTVLTPNLKRDLQLLRMRSVLDPKRHYKGDDTKSLIPEFSQVGTIIEGPTEFFTARLSNKERKRTLLEEVLAGEAISHRFKSKYREVQATKLDGKKAYYKELKARRRKRSLIS